MNLQVAVLEHGGVRLEPLSREHIPGMQSAASGDRASYRFAQVPTVDTAAEYVGQSLDRRRDGVYFPFAQIFDGQIVGHTALMAPRFWPGEQRLLAIEVGTTFLHPSVQGSAVNSISKYLLFTHGFETWGAARVDIKTDARNEQARAGIRAVGAIFEGVLRNWQPSAMPSEEDLARDTAMHSITIAEWPQVKAMLEQRIARKQQARNGSV